MSRARSTPAIDNNRRPIAEVLADRLPDSGRVLEIASGPGAHAAFLATRFSGLVWQPSDIADHALESIRAWVAEHPGDNLEAPVHLDVTGSWPDLGHFDAALNINMLHVSPYPAAADGLFEGVARVLIAGAPLFIYGPFIRPDVDTAASNLRFDDMLRARNPEWGLRRLDELERRAGRFGLVLREVLDMPANNNVLVFSSG